MGNTITLLHAITTCTVELDVKTVLQNMHERLRFQPNACEVGWRVTKTGDGGGDDSFGDGGDDELGKLLWDEEADSTGEEESFAAANEDPDGLEDLSDSFGRGGPKDRLKQEGSVPAVAAATSSAAAAKGASSAAKTVSLAAKTLVEKNSSASDAGADAIADEENDLFGYPQTNDSETVLFHQFPICCNRVKLFSCKLLHDSCAKILLRIRPFISPPPPPPYLLLLPPSSPPPLLLLSLTSPHLPPSLPL